MIYLDHAATSRPKPPAVVAAVQRWFDEVGVSAERGDGPATAVAAHEVRRVRTELARRTGTDADHVAFVSGATEGLNLALRAMLAPGDRVLTTVLEHASVVRPLLALADERQLAIERAGDGGAAGAATGTAATDGGALTERLLTRLENDDAPSLLVLSHASNVTGDVLDVAAVCAAARKVDCRTLVDASQTAGYLPLDVGADVLVASAHKAMHGPPGLGFVASRRDLAPQKHGGTGSSTSLERHPTSWPQAFEAGTPNTPAIFGLAAALDWLRDNGDADLLARANACLDAIAHALERLDGVRVMRARDPVHTPVLSFVHERFDPLELGALLAGGGVHARAGFHCAPWIHACLGTDAGGTLRLSPGPDTSDADVATLIDLLTGL